MDDTTQTTNLGPLPTLKGPIHKPAVLVAHAEEGLEIPDRLYVGDSFVAGRSSKCDLTIPSRQISKQHFKIRGKQGRSFIEDLGSTNGTFVNGYRIGREIEIRDQAVIRVGQLVLVFVEDTGFLLVPPCRETHGMAGYFYTDLILNNLKEAAISKRSVLLRGPSGSGKELAARAVCSMMDSKRAHAPFITHNAGLFATDDEATSTLFGVGGKVFSGVEARIGLIDKAKGGTLFLDEIDALPARVQQSLLRIIEDGKTKRIGETEPHEADLRFLFAANKDHPSCGLAPDLYARLRVVDILPLSSRIADVPSIFNFVLASALEDAEIDPSRLFQALFGDHYEALCLDGFRTENVRGLIDIADKLVTRISAGVSEAMALESTFNERFKDGLVVKRSVEGQVEDTGSNRRKRDSHYEKNKELIIDVYREQKGNVSACERILREMGLTCSRRWIDIYAKRWGIK